MEMLFSGDNISISEKKLAECERRLVDLQKENDQFVQLVAHDLKSPVRKLGTFIERLVLKAGITPGSDAHLYIDKIESSLADLNAMVDSMSAYADLDISPSLQTKFDLNILVNECATEIKSGFSTDEIDVQVAMLPIISANRHEIKLLFTELFANSMKFRRVTEKLQVLISAKNLSPEEKEIFNLAADKDFTRIDFTDNGIGFSAEYNQKIFQPFFKLHGKSTYIGYGLGLAIAQKIMGKHGGLIMANGVKEHGAIFTIIFSQTN